MDLLRKGIALRLSLSFNSKEIHLPLENTTPLNAVKIEVTDEYVSIDGFTTTNKDVISAFQNNEGSSTKEVLDQILNIGAETLRIMGTTATSEVLETVASDVKKSIEDMAKQLVAESGELSVKSVLGTWRSEFATLLSDSFDPTRTDSIMKKFDTAMNTWAENQQNKVISELNLNTPGSSLYGLNDKLTKHVTSAVETLQEQIKNIEIKLTYEEGKKESKGKLASRGNDFEERVFNLVEQLSHEYRDIADNPGKRKQKGKDGNDEGDIVVDLNPSESSGKELKFVWECKVRSEKQADRWLYDELKKGMSNRSAQCGVIATDETTAIGVKNDGHFFRESGNTAILILDTENPDSNAIRFGYLWSRWHLKRSSTGLLESGRVREIMDSINREMSLITAIKGHNSKITKEFELIGPKVEALETNIKEQLNQLQELIESTEKSQNSDLQ